MKILTAFVVAVFLYLQYKLWLSPDGMPQYIQLKHKVAEQQQQNELLLARNQGLQAEVADLKHGHQAVEERARSELGMVKQGEQFYQVVKPDGVEEEMHSSSK